MMMCQWSFRLAGILKFLVLSILLIGEGRGQGMESVLKESPFLSSLEFSSLTSGEIQERVYQFSHQFGPPSRSHLGLFGRYQDLSNHVAKTPHFASAALGLSYKHLLASGRKLSYTASYGSASDELFKDGRDATIQTNLLYQTDPHWIFVVNYSNNRNFLNNVPLPGVIYIGTMTREKQLILGFPFLLWVEPVGNFSFRYQALLPYVHRLKLAYKGWKPLQFNLGVEQDTHAFFYSQREDDDERTFWFERRAYIGLEKSLGPLLNVELQLGRAFDREYFAAQSIGRKHDEVRGMEDAIYLGLGVRSSF
jgi:hypothetical protein